MNQHTLCVWSRSILLCCMMLALVGCDGGIFGTGDGTIVTPADSVDTNSPGSQPPEGTETPIDGEDQPSPGSQPDGADDSALIEQRPFENLQIGSNSNLPLITLINLSATPLNARVDSDVDDLFAAAIQPGAMGEYRSIALESTELMVTDATTENPLLLLSPLNLGAFSVSTLIARDRLPGDGSATEGPDTLPDVEIIALPSQHLPSDDGIARVRLQQSSPLDANDRSASMSLIPADGTPGGSEAELGTVSAATFGTLSDYRLVAPGSYRLVDSLARLAPIPVELAAGEFYTLVLTGLPVELLVLLDSQPQDQSAVTTEQH